MWIQPTSLMRVDLADTWMESALITGAFAAAIGWQTVGTLSPYVLGIWYSGLFLGLFSISLATEQGIALHRLSPSDKGLDHVSKLLGYKGGQPNANAKPPWAPVLAWQMPVMLLNISISLFGLGLMVQIFQQYRITHLAVQVDDPASFFVAKKANNLRQCIGINLYCHCNCIWLHVPWLGSI